MSVFGVFRSVFSHIQSDSGDLLCKSPHSEQMRENKDQKNSEYEHFLRSLKLQIYNIIVSYKFLYYYWFFLKER